MGKEYKFINSDKMEVSFPEPIIEPKQETVTLELCYSFKGKTEKESYESKSLNDAKPFRELYFKLNNWPKDWEKDYKKFVLEDCWDNANYWISKLELDFIDEDFLWNYIRWK